MSEKKVISVKNKAPVVHGYKYISFWQENNIGIIAFLTDKEGNIDSGFLEEMLKALSVGIVDEKLDALVLTGTDNFFLSKINNLTQEDNELIDALVFMFQSLRIPIFSFLNGSCRDNGYEIALLSDLIFARSDTKIIISEDYTPRMGMSLTLTKYPSFRTGSAEVGINCDRIFQRDTFLQDAKGAIKEYPKNIYYLLRKRRMFQLSTALLEEKYEILKKKYGNEL
ncbi:hypothetical protein [Caldiplasma sukawensis]